MRPRDQTNGRGVTGCGSEPAPSTHGNLPAAGPAAFGQPAHPRSPMKGRGYLAIGVVALVAVLGAAACQAAAPISSLRPEQIETIQEAERVIVSKLSPEESSLLINAHGAVVEGCMQKRGWDFVVGTATPEMAGAGPSPMSNLEQWTFADLQSAESTGYGLATHLADLAAFQKRLALVESEARIPDIKLMPPEEAARYQVDFFGTDDERIEIVERDGSRSSIAGGGCIGEAERAVYGDIEQAMRLRDARTSAESDIWGATLSDKAVVGALDTWKTCVAKQGFEFQDPNQAFESAFGAAQSGDLAQERSIATTDAACKAESSLGPAVQAAYLSATNANLAAFEDDLIALQQFEEEALVRAKDILRFGE
jgi:hypothetical protein